MYGLSIYEDGSQFLCMQMNNVAVSDHYFLITQRSLLFPSWYHERSVVVNRLLRVVLKENSCNVLMPRFTLSVEERTGSSNLKNFDNIY
jgi:hypothetical protein